VSNPPRPPLRGEVWDLRLDPTEGHEQGGVRPCLIISHDRLNQSRAEVIVIVPMSTRLRALASHVVVNPPEGGLTAPSEIMCEHLRSLSTDRLIRYLGDVNRTTITSVEVVLRRLLALSP